VIKRSPAPRIHTFSAETRFAFDAAYLAFCGEYVEGRAMLRAGRLARLPAGCFPPVTPFQSERSIVWTTLQPSRGRPQPDTPRRNEHEVFQRPNGALC
jgi:hypothetical protein